MSHIPTSTSMNQSRASDAFRRHRRTFLKTAGASLALLLAACDSDSNDPDPDPGGMAVDLGSGDTGILNYAYALEQLEAAFYAQAIAMPYAGMTDEENQILTDLRDHEIAHRDFLQAALGSGAIPALSVDFSAIDFTDRMSVLSTASVFEDLGVSAYNGAGRLLMSPDLLLVAGKIVSIEARHAAAIRDLLNPKSGDFAGDDVVDANGLDMARMPSEVLTMAGPYVETMVTANNLPTS